MLQFLIQLSRYLVGIQSDTFFHNEFIIFEMAPNVTINNILPPTALSYATSFLECGSCYKRLQTMIQKNNYNFKCDGFVFKVIGYCVTIINFVKNFSRFQALCSAVDEYLMTFREFVFSIEDKELVSFYKRMKRMMCLLIKLSFTLAIHPSGQ